MAYEYTDIQQSSQLDQTASLEQTAQPWAQSMKDKILSSDIVEKIRNSKQLFIEMGIVLCIGFLAGFLFKRYAQYIVVGLLFVGLLFILQQADIISFGINWNRIPELFGASPAAPTTEVMQSSLTWMKHHIWLVLSFVIGFLCGLHVG
jgi:uncharacterized membrane protein (Fun14 family)